MLWETQTKNKLNLYWTIFTDSDQMLATARTWQLGGDERWVVCWSEEIYFSYQWTYINKRVSVPCFMWMNSTFYTLDVLPSFFPLKMLNIHINRRKCFHVKISRLCVIVIIWGLYSFVPLCFLLAACFLSWTGTAASWAQHRWVFHQMDTRYESVQSLSQGLNVCVGLHIAYLETTQVP